MSDEPTTSKSESSGFQIDKFVGTIVAAVFIWIGSNVHNMSIQMASMSTALQNNTEKVEAFEGKVAAQEAKFERLIRDSEKLLAAKTEALSVAIQAVQLEQGRRTGNVAKVELLESQMSQVRHELSQLQTTLVNVNTQLAALRKPIVSNP